MLRRQALLATATSGADILLRHGIQFVITVVLARLIAPGDFGTVALVSLFVGLANVLMDGGLSVAVIRSQALTQTDKSTAFWLNVCIGALAMGLLFLAAPWIADVFAIPVLAPLTMALAANVLISSLSIMHTALLTRELSFRSILVAGSTGTTLSGIVAVVLAIQGHGVWALAIQTIVMSTASGGVLWLLHPWRPSLKFSARSARSLLGFGGFVLAANLSDMVYTRAYTLLVGKLHGTQAVGYYNRADTTQQIPADLASAMFSRVALPVFASVANDRHRLIEGVRLAVRSLMLLNVPVMLTLAALAEPLVLAVFGSPWEPAVPILRILCFAGILWPLHVINLNLLMALGHPRLVLWLELAKKPIGLALLGLGAIWGVMGIAWSQVAFGIIAFLINARLSHRFLEYGAGPQLQDFAQTLALAAPLAGALYAVSVAWQPGPLLELVTLVAASAGAFLSLAHFLRMPALRELTTAIRQPPQSSTESLHG